MRADAEFYLQLFEWEECRLTAPLKFFSRIFGLKQKLPLSCLLPLTTWSVEKIRVLKICRYRLLIWICCLVLVSSAEWTQLSPSVTENHITVVALTAITLFLGLQMFPGICLYLRQMTIVTSRNCIWTPFILFRPVCHWQFVILSKGMQYVELHAHPQVILIASQMIA